MDGILLVDKPKGWSSFDAIRRLKAILQAEDPELRPPKIGHAGTLDPMATGLLIVLLGSACKQADRFLKLDKSYEAEITLGATSSTDDAEGEITPLEDKKTTDEEVKQVLTHFSGEIAQIPPAFSAIKVGGQRAYKLARQGKEVELKKRTIMIYAIQLISYEYPKLQIVISVSSGTYIRSLARDIGEKLGTGAYLSALRRTQIGEHLVKNSIQVEDADTAELQKHLIRI